MNRTTRYNQSLGQRSHEKKKPKRDGGPLSRHNPTKYKYTLFDMREYTFPKTYNHKKTLYNIHISKFTHQKKHFIKIHLGFPNCRGAIPKRAKEFLTSSTHSSKHRSSKRWFPVRKTRITGRGELEAQ